MTLGHLGRDTTGTALTRCAAPRPSRLPPIVDGQQTRARLQDRYRPTHGTNMRRSAHVDAHH
jgi:hypothetical protein